MLNLSQYFRVSTSKNKYSKKKFDLFLNLVFIPEDACVEGL